MAWWDDVGAALGDIGDAVSGAVDAIGEAAEAVVNGAGDVVADVLETVGNAAQDGLGVVGQLPLLGGLTGWLGSSMAGLTNLAAGAVKAAFGIAAGAVAGTLRIVGGLLTLDLNLALKGLLDIASSLGGALVLLGGQILSLGQRIVFCQNDDRALTTEERALLRRVFQNSLALYNIRVIDGWAGAFGLNDRPFTLANTIYMKNTSSKEYRSVLVHECVHVWQYQNVGARYTTDALAAQQAYGGGSGAYDWEAELDERGHARWIDFNREAAAEFMQNLWDRGTLTMFGNQCVGNGAFYNLAELVAMFGAGSATNSFVHDSVSRTDFANESVDVLRHRINPRLSHAFA